MIHKSRSLAAALLIGTLQTVSALTNGGFEASPFSTGWNVTGAPAAGPGLVAGSVQSATAGLSETFTRDGRTVSLQSSSSVMKTTMR